MIAAGACFSPIFRRKQPSQAMKLKSYGFRSIAPACFAMSVHIRAPATEKRKQRQSGWKEYLEQAKELIEEDGGPPRWFSPLECGSQLENSPLMLFLPGQSLFCC
ncbi:unnamed protein product [Lathyrus sativus]|nr:unnamed protein product [Lathyrus sativus]